MLFYNMHFKSHTKLCFIGCGLTFFTSYTCFNILVYSMHVLLVIYIILKFNFYWQFLGMDLLFLFSTTSDLAFLEKIIRSPVMESGLGIFALFERYVALLAIFVLGLNTEFSCPNTTEYPVPTLYACGFPSAMLLFILLLQFLFNIYSTTCLLSTCYCHYLIS